MTDKFKKMSRELSKLCEKINNVTTRKLARELSLKKWKSIREMALIFFSEFHVRCGFCGYGDYKAQEKTRQEAAYFYRCSCCGVQTLCDSMITEAENLQDETLDLINDLITHFENMTVADD